VSPIGDSLLETPTISHPAASSLFVVAKPMPSEFPTSMALDFNTNPLSYKSHHTLREESLTEEIEVSPRKLSQKNMKKHSFSGRG
jgi:hypothetical protein